MRCPVISAILRWSARNTELQQLEKVILISQLKVEKNGFSHSYKKKCGYICSQTTQMVYAHYESVSQPPNCHDTSCRLARTRLLQTSTITWQNPERESNVEEFTSLSTVVRRYSHREKENAHAHITHKGLLRACMHETILPSSLWASWLNLSDLEASHLVCCMLTLVQQATKNKHKEEVALILWTIIACILHISKHSTQLSQTTPLDGIWSHSLQYMLKYVFLSKNPSTYFYPPACGEVGSTLKAEAATSGLLFNTDVFATTD